MTKYFTTFSQQRICSLIRLYFFATPKCIIRSTIIILGRIKKLTNRAKTTCQHAQSIQLDGQKQKKRTKKNTNFFKIEAIVAEIVLGAHPLEYGALKMKKSCNFSTNKCKFRTKKKCAQILFFAFKSQFRILKNFDQNRIFQQGNLESG